MKISTIIIVAGTAIAITGAIITGTIKFQKKQKELETKVKTIESAFRIIQYNLENGKPFKNEEGKITKDACIESASSTLAGLRGGLSVYKFGEKK